MGNLETNKNQNAGQNVKNPQPNQDRQPQQGFDKDRNAQNPQNPTKNTGAQRAGGSNTEADEEVSEKEDLYGNAKDQAGSMNRPEKH